jgi:hypothetical protein
MAHEKRLGRTGRDDTRVRIVLPTFSVLPFAHKRIRLEDKTTPATNYRSARPPSQVEERDR